MRKFDVSAMKRVPILVAVLLMAAMAAWGQQSGPIQPPSHAPVIKRIPLYPKLPPPPMAPAQIVQHFLANETKYKAAFKKYGFLQTVRVEELDSQDNPTGSYQVELGIDAKPDGAHYGRLLGKSRSSLQYLKLSSQDMEVIAQMPFFPLAGKAGANYRFTYRGTEKEGELMTYAFQVAPKTVESGHIYFSGVVWIDKIDLAIVKSYGHFVMSRPKPADALPFSYSFFTTYRENVEGKYWFPSYIRSDDYYGQGNNELPIRLVVQLSDFHLGQPQIPPPKTQ